MSKSLYNFKSFSKVKVEGQIQRSKIFENRQNLSKVKIFFRCLKFVNVQTHLELVKVVVRYKCFSNLKNFSRVTKLIS